ncbi:MAG: DUF2851 family protein [Saprospiraceae bacterium]
MKKSNIPFQEDFLHYVWKTKQINLQNLTTTDHKKIEILDYGRHNYDAGPDFLNALIKIGETVWAGNIEIHLLSSDWIKHQHNEDEAYNNVILHVVYHHDQDIKIDHHVVPCLCLKNKIPKVLIQRFLILQSSPLKIPCAKMLPEIGQEIFNLWKDGLMTERLQQKQNFILPLLEKYTYDWETVFYILLARYFGGKVNDIPFETLAEKTPIDLIRKNRFDDVLIQSLFYGQAGFLNEICDSGYPCLLQDKYQFLQKKYGLSPSSIISWKFSKLRPPNFPTVRIAQFSSLLTKNVSLFSALLTCNSVEEMHKVLTVETHEYWKNHYRFGKASPPSSKSLTTSFKNILIINAFLPLAFIFSQKYGLTEKKDWVLDILSHIKPEYNQYISKWQQLGLYVQSALESQSLLQLTSAYCEKKLCLTCKIGHKIVSCNPK